MPGSAGALRLAVTTAALGLLHVVQVLTRDVASYVVPLTLAVVALALATTARLARVCCAEARLSAVLIGSYSVAAALLPVIVGLPGDGRGPLTGIRLLLVVLGAALVAQVLLHRGAGKPSRSEDSPYASGYVPSRGGRRG